MSFKNRIADILVVAARNLAIEISPDAYSFGTNEVAAIIASDGLSSAVDDPRIEFAFDAPGANNERIRLQLVSGNMSGKELAQLLLYSERKDGSEVSQLIGDAQEHFFDVRGSINSLVLNAAGLNLTGNLAIDGVGNQQFYRKSSPQSYSSDTSLNNDTDLVASLDHDATYEISAGLYYDSPAAADITIAFSVPSGAVLRWLLNATTDTSFLPRGRSEGQTAGVPCAGVGTRDFSSITGMVRTGVTPGNLQLQHCQFVSDVGTTTVQAESWLRTTRVA